MIGPSRQRDQSQSATWPAPWQEEEADDFDWEGEDACDPYKAPRVGSARGFLAIAALGLSLSLSLHIYIYVYAHIPISLHDLCIHIYMYMYICIYVYHIKSSLNGCG